MFFFSSEDKGLLGSKTSRDPLGLIPIWAMIARPVVPHVTEQTHTVAGFQLLVAALETYERYIENYSGNDSPVPLENYFMLFEQAVAYSTYHLEKKWPLPGNQRLGVSEIHALVISLTPRILQNQLGGGVWGLFRGAAGRAKILDDQYRLLADNFKAYAKANGITVLDDTLLGELTDLIEAANKDPKTGSSFSLQNSKHLAENLKNIITNLPHRELLRDFLFPEGSPHTHIVQVIESDFSRQKPWSEGYYRELVERCKVSMGAYESKFENIIKCENIISPVERLFYHLFQFDGNSLQEAAKNSKFDVEQLQAAHTAFFDTLPGELAKAGRIPLLKEIPRFESKESFIGSLIEYHKQVAQSRKREPWMIVEGERIKCFRQMEGSEELEATQGQTWDNDYYLIPLYNVYKSLKEQSHG